MLTPVRLTALSVLQLLGGLFKRKGLKHGGEDNKEKPEKVEDANRIGRWIFLLEGASSHSCACCVCAGVCLLLKRGDTYRLH